MLTTDRTYTDALAFGKDFARWVAVMKDTQYDCLYIMLVRPVDGNLLVQGMDADGLANKNGQAGVTAEVLSSLIQHDELPTDTAMPYGYHREDDLFAIVVGFPDKINNDLVAAITVKEALAQAA